jgi:hypothetical protein
MAYWLGTLIFALVQLFVTLGINITGKPGQNGYSSSLDDTRERT